MYLEGSGQKVMAHANVREEMAFVEGEWKIRIHATDTIFLIESLVL